MGGFTNGANSTTAHGVWITAGSNSAGGAVMLYFVRPDGTVIGSVQQSSATSVGYNTTSDERIKENIVDSARGIDLLKRIRVRDYNYIWDPEQQPLQGFIAQELYDIYPQAVTIGGDDPKTRPWQVDYGKLTPLLVKSVQDIKAENEQLKAESAQLRAESAQLRAESAQLKVFLCGQFPGAPMCHP